MWVTFLYYEVSLNFCSLKTLREVYIKRTILNGHFNGI